MGCPQFPASRYRASMQCGVSLVELLVALILGSILLLGLSNLVHITLQSRDQTHASKQLLEHAQFALQRMKLMVRNSDRLLLPLVDNPATDWPENQREQTIPASAPVGSSTFASAVLAVTLPEIIDLDKNGIPDADDDADGLIDEDPGADSSNDGAAGIRGIDDDGDGSVDEGGDVNDDDEDGASADDPWNDVDDDSDGSRDEDNDNDANADGCSGVCGLDDDGDGNVDEHAAADDDEDASQNEDWFNPVVFYLNNGELVERTPVPWDTGNGSRDGLDYIETTLLDGVTRFSVQRIGKAKKSRPLVEITLELADADGNSIILDTRVRLGSAR